MEKTVPTLTNRRNDPLLTASTHLDSFDGIRQAQVSGDAHRLTAIAQEQLGNADHGTPFRGYTKSLSLLFKSGLRLKGVQVSCLEKRVSRQDPLAANATGDKANDGANADP
mgnify:CR=1 FL=1